MINSKKLEKLEKTLGKEVLSDMEALNSEGVKGVIVQAETAMKEALEQLESNEKYQELKEQLKAMSAGLKEVRKFQNAKIQYALHLLESKGE